MVSLCFIPWRREPHLIYVSQEQVAQVEYLIEQSIQGNHILFDAADLNRVFRKGHEYPDNSELDENQAYAVEHHIEKLLVAPSLQEKRAYLEKLDRPTFEAVVRTYFNIVENNLFETIEARH